MITQKDFDRIRDYMYALIESDINFVNVNSVENELVVQIATRQEIHYCIMERLRLLRKIFQKEYDMIL